jgi:hypothetical protein
MSEHDFEPLDEAALDEALHREVEAERELSRQVRLRLDEYKGKWVAVSDHEVVASANTLDELLNIIRADDVDAVLRVTKRTATAAYY